MMISFESARDAFIAVRGEFPLRYPALEEKILEDIQAITDAANQQDVDPKRVKLAIDVIEDFLFTAPVGRLNPPDNFYMKNSLGFAIMLARMHIMGNDLIAYPEAVDILFGEPLRQGKIAAESARVRVARAVERRELKTYEDATEPNPRRRTRFLRSDVVAFGQTEKHRAALRELNG